MKKLIHENTLVVKTEEGNVLNTLSSSTYVIAPDEGKLIRNKKTGITTESYVGLGSKEDIVNYEEIDKE